MVTPPASLLVGTNVHRILKAAARLAPIRPGEYMRRFAFDDEVH